MLVAPETFIYVPSCFSVISEKALSKRVPVHSLSDTGLAYSSFPLKPVAEEPPGEGKR